MNPVDRARTPDRRPAPYTVPGSAEHLIVKTAHSYERALNAGDVNSASKQHDVIKGLKERYTQLKNKLLPTD